MTKIRRHTVYIIGMCMYLYPIWLFSIIILQYLEPNYLYKLLMYNKFKMLIYALLYRLKVCNNYQSENDK